MSIPELHIDVLIFGGGVAGLWTLARLRQAGYSCVLLESDQLGAGQTIASQGIIHGGVKYALTGSATSASKAIAEMPAIWRACLEGTGEIDLRGVKVLSQRQYLWTTTGIGSRLAGLAASKAIRTPVESIPSEARPEWLREAPRSVSVYAVNEPVLDPRSMLAELSGPSSSAIVRQVHEGQLGRSGTDRFVVPLAPCRGAPLAIHAARLVLAAGSGNARLIDQLDIDFGTEHAGIARVQSRPLHMVMARGRLPTVFGHCVGFSDKPRITITSQNDAQGRTVWYIGGDIAETGVARSPEDQVQAARAECAACLPWLDLGGAQWSTLRINRVEGVVGARKDQRPDEPFVVGAHGAVLAFPTKLAFAPLLASRILRELDGLTPTQPDLSLLDDAQRPTVADLPWEREIPWT